MQPSLPRACQVSSVPYRIQGERVKNSGLQQVPIFETNKSAHMRRRDAGGKVGKCSYSQADLHAWKGKFHFQRYSRLRRHIMYL